METTTPEITMGDFNQQPIKTITIRKYDTTGALVSEEKIDVADVLAAEKK